MKVLFIPTLFVFSSTSQELGEETFPPAPAALTMLSPVRFQHELHAGGAALVHTRTHQPLQADSSVPLLHPSYVSKYTQN